VPALIADAGDDTSRRFLEFFTAKIRNRHTLAAYTRAVARFCAWCEGHGVRFEQLQPRIVAAYIESHPLAAPSVKQHLAAIRMLCDYPVVTGILRMNAAAAVRGPKHSAKRGKTPVLTGAEAKTFLEAMKTETIVGLRDRAVVAVMVYTFGRWALSPTCGSRTTTRRGSAGGFGCTRKGASGTSSPRITSRRPTSMPTWTPRGCVRIARAGCSAQSTGAGSSRIAGWARSTCFG
jgi:hypothetical protein